MGKKPKASDANHFKLCYVEDHFAYFTTAPLSEQWGDDWDDAPYEHNASAPYGWNAGPDVKTPRWDLLKMAYDGPLETPAEIAGMNSNFSVQDINRGATPWLRDRWGTSGVCIPAGVSPVEFARLVRQAKGEVYGITTNPEEVPMTQEKPAPVADKEAASERAVRAFDSRGVAGHEDRIELLKAKAATLWDVIDGIPVSPGNSEAGRLISLAKTELENAVMWAVKACSRSTQ